MQNDNQTRVDRFTNRLKNHPVTSSLIIIGVIIIAIGAVTGALSTITQFLDRDNPSTRQEQVDIPPDKEEDQVSANDKGQEVPTDEDFNYAKKLTADWMESVVYRDAEFIMSITQTPFFFDQIILQDAASVKSKYLEWWAGQENASSAILENMKLTAYTVKEFKKEYPRGSFRDRIMNSQIEIKDTDIVVLLDVDGEGTLFFYRKFGDNVKLFGFWG